MSYRLFNVLNLNVIKTRSFVVKRRVSKIIFKLDLSEKYKIYLIIFYIYLESIREDSYDRQTLLSILVIIKREERYLIDRILKKK